MNDPTSDSPILPVLRRARERLTSWAAVTVIVALIVGGLMLWIAADASEVLRSALSVPAAVVDPHNRALAQAPAASPTGRRRRRHDPAAPHTGRPATTSRPSLVAIAPNAPVVQIARSTIPASSAPAPSPPPALSPPRSVRPRPSTPESSSSSTPAPASSSSSDSSTSSPDPSTSSSASNQDAATSSSSGG